jgi:hypothetical protein
MVEIELESLLVENFISWGAFGMEVGRLSPFTSRVFLFIVKNLSQLLWRLDVF